MEKKYQSMINKKLPPVSGTLSPQKMIDNPDQVFLYPGTIKHDASNCNK